MSIAATVLAMVALPASSAFAVPGTTGTATLTAGSGFGMEAPASVDFSATLDGVAQAALDNQTFDVADNTGSGSGWNITVTSTVFANESNSLAADGTTDTGIQSDQCDVDSACSIGDNSVSYPVTIPAGVDAPAIEIQNAAVGTGMAAQTWTHQMSLAVPATALAGSYSSTWTYSLVSAP
jgi:hypothetical protein